jgi:hypothetical protein
LPSKVAQIRILKFLEDETHELETLHRRMVAGRTCQPVSEVCQNLLRYNYKTFSQRLFG